MKTRAFLKAQAAEVERRRAEEMYSSPGHGPKPARVATKAERKREARWRKFLEKERLSLGGVW